MKRITKYSTTVILLLLWVGAIAQPSISSTTQLSVFNSATDWIVDFADIQDYVLTGGTWNGNDIGLGQLAQGGATTGQVLKWDGSTWAAADESGGGGGGAPTNAQYLVLATDATLTNERVFMPGANVDITDGGAGGNYTVDVGTKSVSRPGDLTPADITADVDNYAPSGLADASVLRLNVTSNATISGLSGGADGREMTIYCIGSATLTVLHNNILSSASNRFFLPGNASMTLVKNQGAQFIYDATQSRWICVGVSTLSANPSVISPAQITAQQNNYAPTGWETANTIRLDFDASMPLITGFSATSIVDGTEKTLLNIGSNFGYIVPDHPDSSPSNRVAGSQDYAVVPGGACKIIYDGTTSKWRVLEMTTGEGNAARIRYEQFASSATAADHPDLAFQAGGGTIASSAGAAGLPSNYQLGTSTGATNSYILYLPKTALRVGRFVDSHKFAETIVHLPLLSDVTNTFSVLFSIENLVSTATLLQVNQIGIRYRYDANGGNWEGVTRSSAGVESTVDLGVLVEQQKNYKLRIEQALNGEVRFFINGLYRGRLSTNLPNDAVAPGARVMILKSAGTSSRALYVVKLAAGFDYNPAP